MNKFFFIIWGDPKFYQTLIFLAQSLSKKGYKIYIFSKNTNRQKKIIGNIDFGKNTKIIKIPDFLSGYLNFVDFTLFTIFVSFKTFLIKPQNFIFFNKKALLISIILNLFKKKKTKFIYHNFDHDLSKNTDKINEKILIKLEYISSKICEYLIFPSLERSKIFIKYSKNSHSKSFFLMNCFPLNYKVKISGKFQTFLKNKKFNQKKIICHLGSIGPDHYLDNIVKSVKYIRKNIILIIGGSSIANYDQKLKYHVKKNNLENRVFIFTDISNNFWFDILNSSNLGLCFYKPTVLSHKFMAGTSQKFNNYLYSNKPMLVNNNSDFKSFKKKYDIFNIVVPSKPQQIAKGINKIFENEKRYKQIKKNMSLAFNNTLNFEYQFSKSYKKILED